LITSIDRDSLKNLPKLWFYAVWNNQLTSLHKTTFQNNPNLAEIYLGKNRISALSNTMFSHLKNLKLLNLENTHCTNKNYQENASLRMAEIENDLRNCAITYLSLENDELSRELSDIKKILMEKLK
jgi:Leucine-rich repeat (LRR) protein